MSIVNLTRKTDSTLVLDWVSHLLLHCESRRHCTVKDQYQDVTTGLCLVSKSTTPFSLFVNNRTSSQSHDTSVLNLVLLRSLPRYPISSRRARLRKSLQEFPVPSASNAKVPAVPVPPTRPRVLVPVELHTAKAFLCTDTEQGIPGHEAKGGNEETHRLSSAWASNTVDNSPIICVLM